MTNNELLDEPTPSKKPGDINLVTVIIPLLSVAFVGALFKMMHWSEYALMLLCPMGIISAYVIIEMMFSRKSTVYLILLLSNLILLGYILWSAFFNGGYPFNELELLVFGGVSLLVFVPLLLIRRAKGNKQRTTKTPSAKTE
jgi:hypothetical protein